MKWIEIMDTTLRDGEQTSGVSFTAEEKYNIAKLLLEDAKVDRIEVASARVSNGEFKGTKKITSWAKNNGYLDKIEVLGFIDGTTSIDWIVDAGCKVVNLLSKGSLNHVTNQLRKTPEQHIADINKAVSYAKSKDLTVNIYLEDWSNGMVSSPEYVLQMIDAFITMSIKRIMLPDTLGILNPTQTAEFIKLLTTKYPDIHFDYHAHNDYDLAVANTLEAVKNGAKGVHVTVNGLGERAGNAPLSSVIGILNDHINISNNIDESKLNLLSRMVETFSGIRIPQNKPLIGDFVFTQCSGIHADGDNKANLYFNKLTPDRFGRKREYALGKTSGKANIAKNLEELGLKLDAEEIKKVTERIIELGDSKENVTTEDLPYIISDVLKSANIESKIKIQNYSLSKTNNLKPVASLSIEINNNIYQESSVGEGLYDAFMKALWSIYSKLGKEHPILIDYTVTIPPGGRTSALVETCISWDFKGKNFKTRGLDTDQTEAAIKATVKMLNIIESELTL